MCTFARYPNANTTNKCENVVHITGPIGHMMYQLTLWYTGSGLVSHHYSLGILTYIVNTQKIILF